MANLNEIIRTDQENWSQIAAGTHSIEIYDDNSEYQVELEDPIILGAEGSQTEINSDNELVVAVSFLHWG